jgi:hypothetical protein
MADEGFEALDNALEEIDSIEREENNEMDADESTWTVQHPYESFSDEVDELISQKAEYMTFKQLMASDRWARLSSAEKAIVTTYHKAQEQATLNTMGAESVVIDISQRQFVATI